MSIPKYSADLGLGNGLQDFGLFDGATLGASYAPSPFGLLTQGLVYECVPIWTNQIGVTVTNWSLQVQEYC